MATLAIQAFFEGYMTKQASPLEGDAPTAGTGGAGPSQEATGALGSAVGQPAGAQPTADAQQGPSNVAPDASAGAAPEQASVGVQEAPAAFNSPMQKEMAEREKNKKKNAEAVAKTTEKVRGDIQKHEQKAQEAVQEVKVSQVKGNSEIQKANAVAQVSAQQDNQLAKQLQQMMPRAMQQQPQQVA